MMQRFVGLWHNRVLVSALDAFEVENDTGENTELKLHHIKMKRQHFGVQVWSVFCGLGIQHFVFIVKPK